MKNSLKSICILFLIFFTIESIASSSNHDSILWDKILSSKIKIQKELLTELKANNFEKALLLWEDHSDLKKIGRDNETALLAYLLFQNGLKVSGLELLFSISNPKRIHPLLLTKWNDLIKNEALPVLAIQKGLEQWNGYLSLPVKFDSSTLKSNQLAKSDLDAINIIVDRLKKEKKGSRLYQDLKWQLSILRLLQDQVKSAEANLSGVKGITDDKILLMQARIAYQSKQFKKAIQLYSKIKENSDYWLESLEEKSWSHFRLNQEDKAISILKTLLAPQWDKQVGPEPYLLQGLIQLNTCDYNGVFKTIELFKSRYQFRAKQLSLLSQKGLNTEQKRLISKLVQNPAQWKSLGNKVDLLPRLIHRDRLIVLEVVKRFYFENEVSKIDRILSVNDSISLTVKKILNQFANRSRSKIQFNESQIEKRVQVLAKIEADEVARILQKMHLLEAEAVQRVHYPFKLAKNEVKKDKKNSTDQLVFKANDEVWIDELNNYQANIKNCRPFLGRRSL